MKKPVKHIDGILMDGHVDRSFLSPITTDVDERHFVVMGKPVPKARPRFNRGHVSTPASTLEYERRVREAYRDAHGHKPIFDADVEFDMLAVMPNRTHGDLDNIIKIVDGLNGVTWTDDKLVKKIHAEMTFDKARPRLEITVRPYKPMINITSGGAL